MSCNTTETEGTAGRYDGFVIYQDTDWSVTVTWYNSDGETPVNLTGYTARAVLYASGQTSIEPTVTLGGALGTIALALTDTVTAAMAATVWQLGVEVIDGSGIKTPILFGNVTVKSDITPAL